MVSVRIVSTVLLSILLSLCPAAARTWLIEPDGSGDVPTIQLGIASAAVGDTVELAEGVFTGTGNWNLDFGGKAITVRSAGGDPGACTIDLGGYYAHRGFFFHSGEGSGSRVEGVTIAGGYHSHGAGVSIQGASPTIADCRFVGCVAQSDGGAVDCTNSASPSFRGCVSRRTKPRSTAGRSGSSWDRRSH